MFKKLVTNLPFSPGLATQVSFYAKRLRQEEFIRRLGLIFVGLALTAQSFMIVSPPESAIAVGPNNIVYSGVASKDDLLQKYRSGSDGNGHNDIKQIFDYYKINETSIMNAEMTTVSASDRGGNLRSIGRYKQGFASEIAVNIPGSSTTVYERNLSEWNGGPYKVIQGERTDGTYFAVIMSCGNIVIDSEDKPERPPTHSIVANCQAITGKVNDLDGDRVPIRAWVRVVNEPKTTDGWVDITDKLPYTIPASLKSFENLTRISVEIQDVNTGVWIQALTAYDVGPCLDPPPPPPPPPPAPPTPPPVPEASISCTSLRWINTENVTKITLQAKAQVENAVISTFSFVIKNASGASVASEDINTSEPEATYTVDLEEFGTYQAVVTVVTDKGSDTNANCQESISIENPVKPVFEILKNKEASNLTQDIENANNTIAKPGDTIEYRLITRNTGNIAGEVEIKEDMVDVLEYAEIIDSDGAKFFEETSILDWGTITIEPNETVVKTITVKVNQAIAGTSRSSGDLASYDLVLRNVYGDDVVNIKVPCSETGKCVEQVVQSLPKTGPGLSTLINTFLLVGSVYFYMRNRQTNREIELIKSEYNYST